MVLSSCATSVVPLGVVSVTIAPFSAIPESLPSGLSSSNDGARTATEPLRVRSSSTTWLGALALSTPCSATSRSGRGISTFSISHAIADAATKAVATSRRDEVQIPRLAALARDDRLSSERKLHPRGRQDRELRDGTPRRYVGGVLVQVHEHVLRVVDVRDADVRRHGCAVHE